MRWNRSRRSLLVGSSAVGLTALAGCIDSFGSTRGATDVVLHNETDERRQVDVTVTRRSGGETPNIQDTFEMEPNSRQTVNNEVIMGADYDVAVSVTSGSGPDPYSETQQWDDAGRPLHVLISDQIEFAIEIG